MAGFFRKNAQGKLAIMLDLFHAYWHLLCPQLAQVMQPSIMRIS